MSKNDIKEWHWYDIPLAAAVIGYFAFYLWSLLPHRLFYLVGGCIAVFKIANFLIKKFERPRTAADISDAPVKYVPFDISKEPFLYRHRYNMFVALIQSALFFGTVFSIIILIIAWVFELGWPWSAFIK